MPAAAPATFRSREWLVITTTQKWYASLYPEWFWCVQNAQTEPGTIKAWLLPSGTILCVDVSFIDYAGWGPQELVGRAFSSLATDSSELDEWVHARCINI